LERQREGVPIQRGIYFDRIFFLFGGQY
jgi:hypothetical protein